jgi:uncharacterized membrane protein
MTGLPLHPAIVHFPIAFYLLGVLLTAATLWRRTSDYERFAYWAFVLAWIGVGAAALLGLVDQGSLPPGDPRRDTINNHITGGVALLILNGLVVYYRFRWKDVLTGPRRWQYLGLMAAGVAALTLTGFWGGELVYRLKVGIQ